MYIDITKLTCFSRPQRAWSGRPWSSSAPCAGRCGARTPQRGSCRSQVFGFFFGFGAKVWRVGVCRGLGFRGSAGVWGILKFRLYFAECYVTVQLCQELRIITGRGHWREQSLLSLW